MNTTDTTSAPADARPLETRAAARPGAPAIIKRRGSGSPVGAITREVQAQGRIVRGIAASEATRRLRDLKERATNALRENVDSRDRMVKRGRAVDVVVTGNIRNATAAIDATERQELEHLRRVTARPRIDPAAVNRRSAARGGRTPEELLYRQAQQHYLRTGETTFRGRSLSELMNRAVPNLRTAWGGNGPDGGFLLTPEYDSSIERLLQETVPMRQHATVRGITSYEYRKPVRTSTGGARWGDELTSSGPTNTPEYSLLAFPAHNLYAEPAVSSDMLEDSQYPIETEINDGALEDFTVTENSAFISGNGSAKPYGILGYAAADYVENASWAWGKIGWKATGASGAFPTPSSTVGSGDPILKLQNEMKAMYRQQAKWMANRGSIGVIRTLKDVEGRYIWSNGNIAEGTPNMLDGREVIEAEEMPGIGADSFAVALADWARAYIIVDRTGLVVLRDTYTRYPNVVFKTRKRVGGGIQNFEAIKLLKFSS